MLTHRMTTGKQSLNNNNKQSGSGQPSADRRPRQSHILALRRLAGDGASRAGGDAGGEERDEVDIARAGHEVHVVTADFGVRTSVAVMQREGFRRAGNRAIDDLRRKQHVARLILDAQPEDQVGVEPEAQQPAAAARRGLPITAGNRLNSAVIALNQQPAGHIYL